MRSILRTDDARGSVRRGARRHGGLATPRGCAAHTNARASSLAAVSFGLTYYDLPRLFTGGLVPSWTDNDRGRELEAAWARRALYRPVGTNVTLGCLNQFIGLGAIPSVIFGTTVMETGQRIMLTVCPSPTRSSGTHASGTPGNGSNSKPSPSNARAKADHSRGI